MPVVQGEIVVRHCGAVLLPRMGVSNGHYRIFLSPSGQPSSLAIVTQPQANQSLKYAIVCCLRATLCCFGPGLTTISSAPSVQHQMQLCREYLEFAAKHQPGSKFAKGHIFKLLHGDLGVKPVQYTLPPPLTHHPAP